MAETSTKKKEERKSLGWGGFVVDTFFSNVESLISTALRRAEGVTDSIIRNVTLHIVLLISTVCGGLFFLIGLAQYLSHHYSHPGTGAMIVGSIVLAVGISVSIYIRNSK